MNREFLKGLGLEDDAIENIMKEHGKTVNSIKDKADSVESLESQIKDYKEQLVERDNQLEALSKVDAKGLQVEIDRLKGENETKATEYQQQLDKQAKEFAVDSYLRDMKAKNIKAVKANLDLDIVSFKDGELTGLKEQSDALIESDAYLFESEGVAPPNTPNFVVGGNPNGGNTSLTKEQIMKEPDNIKRQQLIKSNRQLF